MHTCRYAHGDVAADATTDPALLAGGGRYDVSGPEGLDAVLWARCSAALAAAAADDDDPSAAEADSDCRHSAAALHGSGCGWVYHSASALCGGSSGAVGVQVHIYICTMM